MNHFPGASRDGHPTRGDVFSDPLMSSEELRIENCVAYLWIRDANINDATRYDVDLARLQSLASDDVSVNYNPMLFGSANVRMSCADLKRGRFVALIFPTGKVVIPGLASPSEAPIAADELARWLSTVLGESVKACDFKIPYLVGKFKTSPIDVEVMIDALGPVMAQHGATRFPSCLIFPNRGDDDRGNASYLIFESGKVVITGCRSEQDLRDNKIAALRICDDFRAS